MKPAIENYVRFLQALTPQNVTQLPDHVTADVHFRDPFHEVRGASAMRDIFARMFDQLVSPSFTIEDAAENANATYLKWTMRYAFRHAPRRIHAAVGMTELRLTPEGKICTHLDYWDAAHQLYEHAPILGAVLRFLRRQIAGQHA